MADSGITAGEGSSGSGARRPARHSGQSAPLAEASTFVPVTVEQSITEPATEIEFRQGPLTMKSTWHGHDPWLYLRDVLSRLQTYSARDFDALLPHLCLPSPRGMTAYGQ